ncbi:uncharacterized protein LOC126410442 [Nymphaea colorata]|nr:uncharacterized protein LOC126410442 [Nymphaea colorata]
MRFKLKQDLVIHLLAVAGASILASLSNLGNDLSLLPPPSQSNEDAQQAIGRPALSTAFEVPDDSVPVLDINTCTRKDSADQNSRTVVPLDDNAPAPAEQTSRVDVNVGNIDRAFKDNMREGILDGQNTQVSFDNFPYYLSENTKNALICPIYIHLKHKEFAKFTTDLPTVSARILLSDPSGTLLGNLWVLSGG